MPILRLIILFLLALFFRRLYVAVRNLLRNGRPPSTGATQGGQEVTDPKRPASHEKFREEDISDADFEEIP